MPGDERGAAPDRRRRRRRIGLASGAVAVVAVAGFGVVSVRGGSADDAADATSGAGETATATIERTDLVRSETLEGALGHAEARPIVNQLGGTLTWVAEEGTTIDRGGVVYRVDEKPVLLLVGDLPVYRDLDWTVTGDDIRQLEENLVALGYTDVTVDEEYTSSTAQAVADIEESVGLDGDGKLTLGEVVFTPTPVRIDAASVDLGASVQPGQEVVSVSSTTPVVTVVLETADDLAVGQTVSIELPDGSATPGTVTEVSTTSASAASTSAAASGAGTSDGAATSAITATISVDPSAVAAWDTSDVDVIVEDERRDDVLAAPVTALVALSEGGYAVEVASGSGGATSLVAVTPGMYADDLVEVAGDGIAEGTEVVIPR